MIPRIAHFVFGLREQDEPFAFMHYVALESCRRVVEPERIYLHCKWQPWGPWWDRISPHLTVVEADHAGEVLSAGYEGGHVPDQYRYAHHADFVRLDALIEHGGIYADIDTVFLRPIPDGLFDAPFVIGREPPVRDELTGELRPSLCNALMMGEADARFAREWRAQMGAALDGSWSNHSGFLSERLSRLMPDDVHLEPEVTFFPFPATNAGLADLLERRSDVPPAAVSVHLWSHLWWNRARTDFSAVHGARCTPAFLRRSQTTLAEIVRPYLPARARASERSVNYLSLDEDSGYGVAAARCMAALDESGVDLEWTPFVSGPGWGLGYEPACAIGESGVVVAHLVPEYFPVVRRLAPGARLVGHTVWDTDRLPAHWIECLEAADLLVVPSQFSADAIGSSSVETPVAVVPHVAPAVAPPESAPGREDDVFVFYTIAEWNERKAVFKTVEAYLRAFSARDPVLLMIKTSHRDHTAGAPPDAGAAGRGSTAWALAQLVARHPAPAAVRLVTRNMTNGEIAALHRNGDCFVSLCRSEGFGLGAFDAAAHGNPVVTTGWGGQLDYLGDSPHLVGFDLVPVDDPAGFPSYAPDQRWAEPDVDHGAALLRQVRDEPAVARAAAEILGAEIRRRYSGEAVAARLREAIERG